MFAGMVSATACADGATARYRQKSIENPSWSIRRLTVPAKCMRLLEKERFTRRSKGSYFSACKECNKYEFAHLRRSRLQGIAKELGFELEIQDTPHDDTPCLKTGSELDAGLEE